MSTAKAHPGWSLAIDYGPLLVWFLAYRMLVSRGSVSALIGATGAFMAAIVLAVIVSRIRLGRVSPMLWLSAILVLGFGGLTIYFHDIRFIQHKPTAIYALLGGMLIIGVLTQRPLLKYVLEAGYDGLSDRGWMILSKNWGLFFIAMAGLNELLVAMLTPDTWLMVKVWALPILSVVFTLANVPIAMRHGLGAAPAEPPPVPPQG